MVLAKTQLFDPKLRECALLFKALGHPARLQILKYLAETNICITGDISDELPLSRTTVNQHLTELRKAGLIRGEVSGVNVKYCLDPGRIHLIRQMTTHFFSEIADEKPGICC